jgi:alanine dehydrogenase
MERGMIVGVPKEIKAQESRVGLVPSGVKAFVEQGHRVVIQEGAGLGAGLGDEEYVKQGAQILRDAAAVWAEAEMIVKVKEPVANECGDEFSYMKPGQILYTYLHLAPAPALTRSLLDRDVIGIAYETIEGRGGSLPLLIPMSEVAGRMSVQAGAGCLEVPNGGRGVLLGGVPGVEPGVVVIIGAGIVGRNAAQMAVGLGAEVWILDIDLDKLRYCDDIWGSRVKTLMSNQLNIEKALGRADLVIGAVLIPGARAPHLVTREMLQLMKEGSVVVDVAVDQGGCVETTHPTTHADPTYLVDGIVHYGVANMPGAVARTSTFALTNATLPFGLRLAGLGIEEAVRATPGLRPGVNVYRGAVTYRAVADSLGLTTSDLPF